MAHPWEPEHPVDRALAARLIAAQFPAVALDRLERLGEGWDNDVWLADGVVFRFPRRRVAVPLLENEGRALPLLAGQLPVRVPEPQYYGRPSAEFPCPFLGYRLLPGRPGDRVALTAVERAALAAPLGRFLRALHAVDLARFEAVGVPEDWFRADVPRYLKLLDERMAALAPRLSPELVERIGALRKTAAALPPPVVQRRALVHGDLYLRHLVFDDARRWTAVIDWGDVSVADPLADLTVIYTGLSAAARPGFFDTYGRIEPVDALRARLIGLVRHGVSLLAYALDRGDGPLEAEARRAIDHALD